MGPLAWTSAAIALLRASMVIALHVQARSAGFAEPLPVLLATLSAHVGVTLVETALVFWLLRRFPSRTVAALTCGYVLALCIWTIADPVIFTLAGDHLTPSLLAHFAGFNVFTSDYLWQPVRAHPALSAGVVAGAAAAAALCVAWYRAVARAASHVSRAACARYALAGLAALAAPFVGGLGALAWPPEILYALDALPRKADGASDIAELRSFVGLPAGAAWLDADYPLVYAPAPAARTRPQPDVVVINIESLRGQDLRWVTGRPDGTELPALEALARRAVVFPHFISNGFPSSEGFISTATAAWPHDRRRIVLDFKEVKLDFLSARLRSLGYRTVRVEHDPDFGDEGRFIRASFDEWITQVPGKLPSELDVAREIGALLDRHDQASPGRPLFIDWKTANPHMPYNMPGESGATPRENYPRTLRMVDTAVGQVLDALARRKRAADTLVIVLGDHSNWVESARTTALPSDEMVWTGAMIAAGPRWIGPPRRDLSPASQVDIMPTVLALVGDTRPTAALGRDLFAEGGRPKRAFAVRPGGVRLDENGATTLVDRRYVYGALRSASFETRATAMRSDIGAALVRNAERWGRLVEQNRVWNPALLDAQEPGQ